MKEMLLYHLKKTPDMQIQDAVKLLFQREFGPGHLIENVDYAKRLLQDEIELTKDVQSEVVPVSDKLVRLHFGGFTQNHAEVILEAMIETAREVKPDVQRFIDSLNELKEMNLFDSEKLNCFLEEYLKRDSYLISHSETYRSQYHPHYRVLKKELAEKVMNELRQ